MIVITGGAGFIGSVFLDYLNKQGISNILVVDNLGNTSKWKNLINKSFIDYVDKIEFIEKIKSNSYSKDLKAIFHLGACTNTTELDSNYLIENNFKYSKTLAEYAFKNNIKFIFASSAATYGLGDFDYNDNIYKELRPINAYGYSKQLFDAWLYNNDMIDNVLGLKFFNVFGPNEYHKANMASMVYKAYNQIQESKQIKLFKSNDSNYENGQQDRDFIYVKDVVALTYKLYESKAKGIYNIGTGVARSWNDLAKSVFNSLDLPQKIEYIDMPSNLISQYQNHTQANITKLLNKVEHNFFTLEEAVKDYTNNYLQESWQYI